MGRGRAEALLFGVLVGLKLASFIPEAEGEGAGNLGWRHIKTFQHMTLTVTNITFKPRMYYVHVHVAADINL